jgi:NADPH:quinone reductase-like Zn-dependent oxidoreductase
VRAALIKQLGALPEAGEAPEPEAAEGEVVLEVAAAALNPIDVNVAAGRYHGGHPPFAYVPGCECVGRVDGSDGLYWAYGSIGLARDGGMAERVGVPRDQLIEVPEGADPALAAAFGIAGLAGWLPVAWRAPLAGGETVLVLGATGTVGLVALQAARLLGAGRVVAAGRNEQGLERARARGADAVVRLDSGGGGLGDALREACGGDGANVIVDPLWGEPLAAALAAAAPRARIVHLGQSAGPEASLSSAHVRGKQLDILGHTNFLVPRDELAREYQRLVQEATAGRIELDVERVPLDQVAEAWERQASGADSKLVIVP